MKEKNIKIIKPWNGDFMYKEDGYEKDNALFIPVTVQAPSGSELFLNGRPMKAENGVYEGEAVLTGYESKIVLTDKDNRVLDEIRLYWAKNTDMKYRFSLDDNIWWLRDLAKNASVYKSLFDNPFLAFFKKLHDAFGTKVHFNIYYQDEADFNLSMMPEKYKGEFIANSDWIALTFHALANDPDKPYENTTYEKIYTHCQMVTDEIKRFAGEEVLSDYTTIHWGAVNREGCKALKDFGFKGLVGYFEMVDGKPLVSYYFDEYYTKHINQRDIYRDTEFGLTFIKNDMVVNTFKREDIIPSLEKTLSNPHTSRFIELMIHEQYYHPHYIQYQPDYEQKIWDAVKLVAERGYKPAFLKEIL
ncbi:MAG: hypothetical protein ACOX3Q_01220 [Clostridia bacterium]|jgi:hypothetical protein|nr:hypothetical protein [Clostridiaceae bacterium]